jgi:hypothetical protein
LWLAEHPDALPVSAETGEGLDRLAEIVRDFSIGPPRSLQVTLATADSRAVTFLERRTPVTHRDYAGNTVTIHTTLGARQAMQLLSLSRGVRVGDELLADVRESLWPSPKTVNDTCRIPPHRLYPSDGWQTDGASDG